MKFEIGDYVKTTKLKDATGTPLFPIGTIGKIIEVTKDIQLPYLVEIENGDDYFYAEDMLERYIPIARHGEPEIKDSGARTVFETGAVRDIQEDKGRCDLLPLDVVTMLASHLGYDNEIYEIMADIANFMHKGKEKYLFEAIQDFCRLVNWNLTECILEVSMHYKHGAEKYGERNWEKGIYLHSYIDSGVRHFLKYIDGQKDERHDRAFVWNMLGAIWTMNHRPKMIDIPFELLGSQEGEE